MTRLFAVLVLATLLLYAPTGGVPAAGAELRLCPWELTVPRAPEAGLYRWELWAEEFQQNITLPHSRWRRIDRGDATLVLCLHCTQMLATGYIVAGPISRLHALVQYPSNPGTGLHLNHAPRLVIAWPAQQEGCPNLDRVRAFPVRGVGFPFSPVVVP